MWRPNDVVPRHKRRAAALWILLIVSIIAYSSYLLFAAIEKSKNPATSFVLSNEVYRYPDLSMCLYNYYGCDEQPWEEECVTSANNTEGGSVKAVYHPGGENEQNVSTYYTLTKTRGWCVVFKTSEVVVELGKTRDPGNYLDYVLLDLYWYPGGAANNSTTCMSEDGEWKDHSESIFGFLNDSETGLVSTGIQVPYTCMTNESTSYTFTYVGIGLTRELRLDSDKNKFSYKATRTSSVTDKIERTPERMAVKAPYAYIAVNFAQQPDSLEEISDINPFEIAELLGSVGGFWDLIMIFWPIFFVAAAQGGPNFKFRDFKKSMETVADGARTITSTISVHPHSKGGVSRSEVHEELPSWERSSHQPKEDEVLIRLFDEHRLVAVVNGARIKAFLKSKFSATSLKDGATEPSLKKLLPAKTFLVGVPPGCTTTAIAKAVESYCKLGGDNTETFGTKPITVKAKQVHCSVVQAHALSISEYVGADNEVCNETDLDLGEAGPAFSALPERKPSIQRPLEAEAPRRRMYSRSESFSVALSLEAAEDCSKN